MPIGVYYYPEAWPKNQWKRDLDGIKKLGFEFTHFAEFSWAFMEPQEGKYNFGWLDSAIDLADKAGLKVIMCTPTPTPPAWMITKYPDIAMVNNQGVRLKHGTRTHISWASPVYREFVAKLVTALAKHYGQDKRIMGWQLDNEPSHYSYEADYGPDAQKSFVMWLKKKYPSLNELNKAWGASFWSQIYTDWNQLRIPNEKELVHGYNPHAILDFKRYNAEECADFLNVQKDVIKKYSRPSQWVTTNFMGSHLPVDPWRSKGLDFVSYTCYPVAGYTNGVGEQGFRLGQPYLLSYLADFYRSIKGVTGIMELQPGQVNWGRYNPQPLPGAVRTWLYATFAGGASFACSYRYRQPLYGSELYHYGMVDTDGITPTPGGLEYSQVCREMQELRKTYSSQRPNPSTFEARRTAIMYSHDNVWDMDFQKQTNQWSSTGHVMKYHTALKRLGVPVDFVSYDSELGSYRTLVVPAAQLMDESAAKKLEQYARNGGTIIMSCRSGQKDLSGQLYESAFTKIIVPIVGVRVKYYDVLDNTYFSKVFYNGKSYQWNNWAEILAPSPNTQILAQFEDQFYKSEAAITKAVVGKGTAYYIGVDTDNGDLEREVLKSAFADRGIAIEELPEGIVKDYRDGFGIIYNLSSTAHEVSIPAGSKVLIGKAGKLAPADVIVYVEK